MQIDTGYSDKAGLAMTTLSSRDIHHPSKGSPVRTVEGGVTDRQMAGVCSEAMEREALTASPPHHCFFPDLTTQEVGVRFR